MRIRKNSEGRNFFLSIYAFLTIIYKVDWIFISILDVVKLKLWYRAPQIILDIGQPVSKIEIPDVWWGGECRVELALTARSVGRGEIQGAKIKVYYGRSPFGFETQKQTLDGEHDKELSVGSGWVVYARMQIKAPHDTNVSYEIFLPGS